MDECSNGAARCGAFQECVNLPGSYECQTRDVACGKGFEVDPNTGICIGELFMPLPTIYRANQSPFPLS